MGLGSAVSQKLDSIDKMGLEKDISEVEVETASLELSSDKAPGPEGFNVHYIKKFRGELKGRILDGLRKFWDLRKLPKGFNSSFLALIPKVLIPKRV